MHEPIARLTTKLALAAATILMAFALSAVAQTRDYFGAIAVSPSTLKYGWSANKDTLADAKAEAVKGCGRKDCEAQTYYWNGCGGLAFGDNNAWGSHWASDLDSAHAAAIKACAGYGQNCRVERVTCSLGEASSESPRPPASQCAESARNDCGSQCRNDVICQTACIRRKLADCP